MMIYLLVLTQTQQPANVFTLHEPLYVFPNCNHKPECILLWFYAAEQKVKLNFTY